MSAERSEKKSKQKVSNENFKRIHAIGNGNCAFNAFILAAADAIVSDKLDKKTDEQDSVKQELQNNWVALFKNNKINKKEAWDWDDVRRYFQSKKTYLDQVGLQNTFAPILRHYSFELNFGNIENYKANTINAFLAEFDGYAKRYLENKKSIEPNDIFVHCPIIKKKFDSLLKNLNNEQQIDEKNKELENFWMEEGALKFLNYMNQSGTWAGDLELTPLAENLIGNLEIKGKTFTLINQNKELPKITLINKSGNHWDCEVAANNVFLNDQPVQPEKSNNEVHFNSIYAVNLVHRSKAKKAFYLFEQTGNANDEGKEAVNFILQELEKENSNNRKAAVKLLEEELEHYKDTCSEEDKKKIKKAGGGKIKNINLSTYLNLIISKLAPATPNLLIAKAKSENKDYIIWEKQPDCSIQPIAFNLAEIDEKAPYLVGEPIHMLKTTNEKGETVYKALKAKEEKKGFTHATTYTFIQNNLKVTTDDKWKELPKNTPWPGVHQLIIELDYLFDLQIRKNAKPAYLREINNQKAKIEEMCEQVVLSLGFLEAHPYYAAKLMGIDELNKKERQKYFNDYIACIEEFLKIYTQVRDIEHHGKEHDQNKEIFAKRKQAQKALLNLKEKTRCHHDATKNDNPSQNIYDVSKTGKNIHSKSGQQGQITLNYHYLINENGQYKIKKQKTPVHLYRAAAIRLTKLKKIGIACISIAIASLIGGGTVFGLKAAGFAIMVGSGPVGMAVIGGLVVFGLAALLTYFAVNYFTRNWYLRKHWIAQNGKTKDVTPNKETKENKPDKKLEFDEKDNKRKAKDHTSDSQDNSGKIATVKRLQKVLNAKTSNSNSRSSGNLFSQKAKAEAEAEAENVSSIISEIINDNNSSNRGKLKIENITQVIKKAVDENKNEELNDLCEKTKTYLQAKSQPAKINRNNNHLIEAANGVAEALKTLEKAVNQPSILKIVEENDPLRILILQDDKKLILGADALALSSNEKEISLRKDAINRRLNYLNNKISEFHLERNEKTRNIQNHLDNNDTIDLPELEDKMALLEKHVEKIQACKKEFERINNQFPKGNENLRKEISDIFNNNMEINLEVLQSNVKALSKACQANRPMKDEYNHTYNFFNENSKVPSSNFDTQAKTPPLKRNKRKNS